MSVISDTWLSLGSHFPWAMFRVVRLPYQHYTRDLRLNPAIIAGVIEL